MTMRRWDSSTTVKALGYIPQSQNKLLFQALQWHHNECNCIPNHWLLDCLLNCLFKENIKATRHWPLSAELVGDQWISSNVENVSIKFLWCKWQSKNARNHQMHMKLIFSALWFNDNDVLLSQFKINILHYQPYFTVFFNENIEKYNIILLNTSCNLVTSYYVM